MEDRERLEHQIELATRIAATTLDQSTASRLRRFADDLKQRLFHSSRRRRIRARAFELWEQAGRPTGRDFDFWLLAETETDQRKDED
ncbi:DUF2934 domain-containing protein [Bradyrhizobium sp. BR 10261]|uniref:DUF2934 domain-containing protein n=1 Tax=Bradyrhizobium sp. BR 10261 TaxID=2749992 RepID=UPI001C648DF1|nr:DUF2934 domain-containing protein [Bradyrhizobium sp. BR 10261]MBW7964703.1 DUF2934 domain-containing protein [Bradyrhizobium sp. BR 10261]